MQSTPATPMQPPRLVELIAEQTGLLTQGLTWQARALHAQEFTREVARQLFDHGYGLMFKTAGLNIGCLALDRIVHRDTGEVVQVVADAGTDAQRPSWRVFQSDCRQLYVHPENPHAMIDALTTQEVNVLAMRTQLDDLQRAAEIIIRQTAQPRRHAQRAPSPIAKA